MTPRPYLRTIAVGTMSWYRGGLVRIPEGHRWFVHVSPGRAPWVISSFRAPRWA